MNAPLATRLPGVRVTAAPTRVPDSLPRMDIAVFVGLAASGPVNLPVVVEVAVQFGAIFGADASLAWDARRGAPARARLGPAVRAFFANGGRRCWIIRVADAEAAEDDRFAVPGVLALDPARPDEGAQAELRARAPGSWADGLRLRAAMTGAAQPLLAADLFKHELSPPTAPYPPFVDCAPSAAPRPGDLLRFTWQAENGRELTALHAVCGPWDPRAHPDAPKVPGGQVRVTLTDTLWTTAVVGPAPLPLKVQLAAGSPADATGFGDGQGGGGLDLASAPELAPRPGDVLTCTTGVAGEDPYWFLVREVVAQALAGSPAGLQLSLRGLIRRRIDQPADASGLMRCDRVALDLSVDGGADEGARLRGLGFAPAHSRFAGRIPDDQTWFATTPASDTDGAPVPVEPSPGRRFPLAALAGKGRLLVPLFGGAAEGFASTARHSGAPALARDGLATFGPDLFIDPGLAQVPLDQLMKAADDIRYRAAVPRRLTGMHIALGIDESAILEEATLIAAPDAALPGWEERGEVELAVRGLEAPPPADDCQGGDDFRDCRECQVAIERLSAELVSPGDVIVFWTASDEAAPCVLEAADNPDFKGAVEIYRGPGGACPVVLTPGAETYFRVRPDLDGQTCAFGPGIAVELRDHGQFRMREPAASAAPALDVHRALLRLCAARGDLLAVLALPEHFSADQAIDHAARLKTIAAPGFDGVQPLGPGEERALSYGALYHPWLAGRGSDGELERAPPDGAMTGVMAARAIRRGAWIAPANEPLRGVLALAPALPEGRRLALVEAGVNLISHEPRGFLPLAADTLSLDPDLQPINVRRLMILIRRVALRHGVRYVFEPNDAALRRTVERTFEALLGELYQRGAFAGARPETSFRVDCGPQVNPPANQELGRFVVEIRVAPSLPMRFLTVMLVQSGGALVAAERGAP